MDSQVGPTTTIASPPPSPPPEFPEVSPVGSPDHTADDAHDLPSEDDQDHGLDHDQVHGDEPVVETGALTEDLKRKIMKQASSPLFQSLLLLLLLFSRVLLCVLAFKL